MADGAPQLTPGKEVDFLKQYEDDARHLEKLQSAYRDAVSTPMPSGGTGNVSDYVKEYADKNNKMLEAHEAVQNYIKTMQGKYVDFGIPPVAALGHINEQVAFLKNLDAIKRQAAGNLMRQEQLSPAVDKTIRDEREKLINFATGTNRSLYKMNTALADIQNKTPIDALSFDYQMMWHTTYMRDRRYAERLHRLALEGRGRESAYDINGRTGWNLQFAEYGVETIGVKGEDSYFGRMRTHAGLSSIVRWGGMERLGQFAVTRTEYTDASGQPLKDLNGNFVRGPAHTLIIQEVSIYGGYSNISKIIFASNDEARLMQAGYALGGLLSSHVNNTAILLDEEAIKNNKTITEEHRKSLLDAKADAEAQAKDFMENGITIDEIAPGYGGMDFFYQMQAVANTMGIPFNKNGPSLEAMLQKQIDNNYYKPHLRMSAEYAIWQVRKRGASMQKASQDKLDKSIMGTPEYKSLRDYTIARKLINQYETYKDAHPGSQQIKLYEAYKAFENNFQKNHPTLFDLSGKHIKDPEEYAKVYAKALQKEFGRDFEAIKGEIEKPGSPERAELIKNGGGARFTGREDWYRRLKLAAKDLVTASNKSDLDGKVTASNDGTGANTSTHPLHISSSDTAAAKKVLDSGSKDPRAALTIASTEGGDTFDKNYENDMSLLIKGATPEEGGLRVLAQADDKVHKLQEDLENQLDHENVAIIADVGASKKSNEKAPSMTKEKKGEPLRPKNN